jgi:hypothetical protein
MYRPGLIFHEGQFGFEAQEPLFGLLNLQEELIDLVTKLLKLGCDEVRWV